MGKRSKRWLRERERDEYVKLSRAGCYRSRAVFKLRELAERDGLFRGVSTVVDLGAAPGSWSQFAREKLGGNARIWAVDILPMEPVSGVEFIRGDFRDAAVLDALLSAVGEKRVELVMSDMAPNMSGMSSVDQARAMHLCELALDLGRSVLAPGGTMLVKAFMGEGYENFVGETKNAFDRVKVRKPRASRPRSREVYVLGSGFRA